MFSLIIVFATLVGLALLTRPNLDIIDPVIMSSLFITMGIALILGTIGSFVYNHPVYKGPHIELINLADGQTNEGHLFLGSGTIRGIPKYSWYLESSKNTYTLHTAPANRSSIHYIDSGTKPYFVESIKHGGKIIHNWLLDLGAGGNYVVHWDFYVPRGSITSTYHLDAQ